jgi:hypothetical protein
MSPLKASGAPASTSPSDENALRDLIARDVAELRAREARAARNVFVEVETKLNRMNARKSIRHSEKAGR